MDSGLSGYASIIILYCLNCKFSILSAPPCGNHMLLPQCTVHCNTVFSRPDNVTHTSILFALASHKLSSLPLLSVQICSNYGHLFIFLSKTQCTQFNWFSNCVGVQCLLCGHSSLYKLQTLLLFTQLQLM